MKLRLIRHILLTAFLVLGLRAFGQIVLVGGCAANATNCTPAVKSGKTFASGQFIYTFAYRTATTAPTLSSSPTFTQIATASASSSSFRSGCAVATSGSPSSGTWANATYVVTLIYSGSPATTTANCVTTGVGFKTAAGTSGTGTTVTFTGGTLTRTAGNSWVVGAMGDSTTACYPASGLTSEEATGLINGGDTEGGVASFSSKTCTGSGNWKSDTFEIFGQHATPTFGTNGGSSNNNMSTTILDGDASVVLCLTLNGDTPTAGTPGTCDSDSGNELTYSSSITINHTGTVVKAIATSVGVTNSAVATSSAFTLTVGAVTDSPGAGTYTSTQTATLGITTTTGGTVHYTTDNSTSSCASSSYSTPLSVASTEHLRAVGCKTNYVTSGEINDLYTINLATGANLFTLLGVGGPSGGPAILTCGPPITDTATQTDGSNAGNGFATPCTVPSSDTNGYLPTSFMIYNANTSSATENLGVYSNNVSGYPGVMNCSTGSFTMAAGPGWVGPYSVSGCSTVSAGATIWVMKNTSSSNDPAEGVISGDCPGTSLATMNLSETFPTLWTDNTNGFGAGYCYLWNVQLTPQ
jgi:hypothetical protein